MTDVTFYYPEWLSQMSRIIGILRPGALLVMSFRSQYFDSLLVARGRCWHNVDLLLEERRGHIFDSQKEFSWQTSDEIRFLLTREYKLDLHELAGVGVCSGVSGDPHDHIVRPSQLDAAGQVALKKMEMELGRRVPDAGRYMLAVAQKPKIDNKNKSLLK